MKKKKYGLLAPFWETQQGIACSGPGPPSSQRNCSDFPRKHDLSAPSAVHKEEQRVPSCLIRPRAESWSWLAGTTLSSQIMAREGLVGCRPPLQSSQLAHIYPPEEGWVLSYSWFLRVHLSLWHVGPKPTPEDQDHGKKRYYQ